MKYLPLLILLCCGFTTVRSPKGQAAITPVVVATPARIWLSWWPWNQVTNEATVLWSACVPSPRPADWSIYFVGRTNGCWIYPTNDHQFFRAEAILL